MVRKSTIVALILVALSSGCTIKAHGVKVKSPGIEVGLSGGGGAVHCPPGQAKKGNC